MDDQHNKNMIRVLIAEDSPTIAKLIEAYLSRDPEIMVVGLATNGREACEMVEKYKPDIVTMDMHMPVMDGYEATKQIMAYYPTPIIVLSSSVFRMGTDKVFEALSYGALDVMKKSSFEDIDATDEERNELIYRIKLLAKIQVVHHPLAKIEKHRKQLLAQAEAQKHPHLHSKIVGIVASTGGPNALSALLKDIPSDFSAPILIVQHMSPGFVDGLVSWLAGEIKIKIKLATQGEIVQPGVVYVAPTGLHIRVNESMQIQLTNEDPVDGHKPSGTGLLQSLAKVFGVNSMGILLTGMGRDGAKGLEAIYVARGYTIIQDEKTSAVYGMPKMAKELGVAREELPLNKIALSLVKWSKEE